MLINNDVYIAYHSSPFMNFTFTAVHSVTSPQEDNRITTIKRKRKDDCKKVSTITIWWGNENEIKRTKYLQ